MKVIVGLGNPGAEYEHTRHNAGFDALDHVAQEVGATYWKTTCGCLAAEGKLRMPDVQVELEDGTIQRTPGEVVDVVVAKPQSFMNRSGGPVQKLLAEYNATPEDLIVIHDDLDLEPGRCRVKLGGGHAGHNGMKSIFEKLGTREFYRVRIGIGHPPGRKPVEDYVLELPRKEEAELFGVACATAADAAVFLLREGLAATQQRFN